MLSRITKILASAAALFWVAGEAYAQAPSKPIAASPLAPNTSIHTRPLDLSEAISLGVQNNLGVEVNRYSPYAAQYESEAAWGAYNPLFEGEIVYGEQTQQNAFITSEPSESDQLNGSAGISALIPYWGGMLTLDFDAGRSHSDFALERLSPLYLL